MAKTHVIIPVLFFTILLVACNGGGSGSALLYSENFDEGNSCFDSNAMDIGALSIENGELILEITEPYSLYWDTCEEVTLTNFTIELDMYDDTSGEGFHFYGLQLRSGSEDGGPDQYYVVRFGMGEGISSASCVGFANENSFEDITKSPSGDSCWVDLPEPIHPGQWNHFEITLDGPMITYKVNDVHVASINDARLTQGSFALLAGTHDEDSARIKFDNIRITALDE
ncbi:MAG: DUF1080 domain-containing protein [Anaerolineales bacterium]|jgi:hypothetical protein